MKRFESIRNWVVSGIVILTFLYGLFGGARNLLVGSIEDAISNLENKVGHIEGDMSEMKKDISEIRGDIKVINNTVYNHIDSRLSRIEEKLGINE